MQIFVKLTSWFNSPWERLKRSLVRTVPLRWLQMYSSWDQFTNFEFIANKGDYSPIITEIAITNSKLLVLSTWSPYLDVSLFIGHRLPQNQHYSFMHFIVFRRSWQFLFFNIVLESRFHFMRSDSVAGHVPWRSGISEVVSSLRISHGQCTRKTRRYKSHLR